MTLTKIRKRDGRLADFDQEKIAGAIEKAFNATYKPGRGEEAVSLSGELTVRLEGRGEARELDCFSAGQADLILFCLRLAMVDALFSGERPFLVLDDPFADLDDARLSAALALLRELGEERQILYLTCASARAPEWRVESRE